MDDRWPPEATQWSVRRTVEPSTAGAGCDGDKEESIMKALATLCLTGLLLTGALAPSAFGENRPAEPTAIERLVRQEDARRSDPALGITRATQVISVPSPPRITVVTRDGFDWLDAAIGATTAAAILAALGGAALVARSVPRHA